MIKAAFIIGLFTVPAVAGMGYPTADRRGSVRTGYVDASTAAAVSESVPQPVPSGLTFTTGTAAALTATWSITDPAGDSYLLAVSSVSDFSSAVTSSSTALLIATVTALNANTTYYGRINGTKAGSTSNWSETVSTNTLASIPATAVSTWSAVGQTTATITWTAGLNPASVTRYVVEVSTGAFPNAFGNNLSSSTYGLSATFTGLIAGTTYWSQVKAINHGNIATAYASIGSTVTAAGATIFLTDTFTDTDNDALDSAHTGEIGATWTEHSSVNTGDAIITSNRIRSTGANASIHYASGLPSSADYYVETVIFQAGSTIVGFGPAGRIQTGANTCYFARYISASTRWELFKTVAGASTSLGTFTHTTANSASYTIRLQMIGTAIKVYKDGVEIISATDGDITAAGRAGIRGASSGVGGHHIDSITASTF